MFLPQLRFLLSLPPRRAGSTNPAALVEVPTESKVLKTAELKKTSEMEEARSAWPCPS